MSKPTAREPSPRTLTRRLLPLQLGIGLQGFVLWVPVEKLFMTEIGFTAASVGVMAAAYAAVVPLLEVPSGILADRSSRNVLMVLSSVALAASVLVGGLSRDVPTYVVSAVLLGVYFAMASGTVDSMVYDTVLEETGSSALYERWIGRVRMVEAAALVGSALIGGLLAGWTSPRLTYFATLPFIAVSVLCFVRFREPRLHRASEPTALRTHVVLTLQVMVRDATIRRVVLLTALTALLSQAIFEFGPLWLVSFGAPAAAYGPYWAALVASLGVGGYLVGKLPLDRRWMTVVFAVALVTTPLVLVVGQSLVAVVVAQVVLALLVAIVGIHAGLLLHDAVTSNVRAGVSSGVGTLGWLLFLPFSLAVGWVGRAYGQDVAGWLFVGAAAALSLLLVVVTFVRPSAPAVALVPAAGMDDLPCREVVELLTDHLDGRLPADLAAQVNEHLSGCDGCTHYLQQLREIIEAVGHLTPADVTNLVKPGRPRDSSG